MNVISFQKPRQRNANNNQSLPHFKSKSTIFLITYFKFKGIESFRIIRPPGGIVLINKYILKMN